MRSDGLSSLICICCGVIADKNICCNKDRGKRRVSRNTYRNERSTIRGEITVGLICLTVITMMLSRAASVQSLKASPSRSIKHCLAAFGIGHQRQRYSILPINRQFKYEYHQKQQQPWLPTSRLFSSSTETNDESSVSRPKRTTTSGNKLYRKGNYKNPLRNKPKPKISKKKEQQPKSSKKFKINDNITQEQVDRLAEEFHKLAIKDGFDDSTSYFSDDKSFEDDFEYDDEEDFFLDDEDDSGATDSVMNDKGTQTKDLLDPDNFDISDFEKKQDIYDEVDDDDFIDFGTSDSDGDDDMDDRIAAAMGDRETGHITVPKELDDFASGASDIDLSSLGFKRELNPFGNDETPRKDQFKLISDAMTCSACGAEFQCRNEKRPGYLPPAKHEIQVKLAKLEEMQKLQDKADANNEWSTEDEIEWLIQTSGGNNDVDNPAEDIDIDAMAEEMGLDLLELSKKKTICKRCHGLQNFGEVDESLRPGWTDEPLLSQQEFRNLLTPIREKTAVIIALVDLFDFSGSVLPELDAIAGNNPVILAANKVDLLPSKMGETRAENWVRRELEYMNIRSIANIGGAVRLVSCKTGFGLTALLGKARSLADEMDCDVYVVGAANAGKSTLINFILDRNERRKASSRYGKNKKVNPGKENKRKGELTTSPLPGTTLKFIKVDLGEGKSLYDTPGLLVNGTLTQLLTPSELKVVVPKKPVEPITFRVKPGKCVLVGGLARIEVFGDSKPFLFTFFVANDIKLHLTDVTKVDSYIESHVGRVLTPPLDPGLERMEQIGEFESHVIDIEGAGWKEASADITLRGLGWVAVTGPGTATVKVSVPKGIGVSVRPPLMPFDIWEATAKYTGTKSIRKGGKTKSGKTRKGVGRK